MAGGSDTRLTGLAAGIFREAVAVLGHDDFDGWPVGDNTASLSALTASYAGVSGSFLAVTGSFQSPSGSFKALGNGNGGNDAACLKKAFKLPDKLPATRLPSIAQLARTARSAPLMAELEALAKWLGHGGRLVTADHALSRTDAADAVKRLGVQPQYLPYLLDYALTAGWLALRDEPSGNRTWMMLGETAWRWADGDDSGALHVWATVFAALLARTLHVAASIDPAASRRLKLQGQGVAVAVRLFLARRDGLSGADVRHLVMTGAIGDRPSSRARRAWDDWIRGHGHPARWLLSELAALRAIGPPNPHDRTIKLTPLALWALREQLRLDGITIPLLKATSPMTAATFVAFAEGVSEAEDEAAFASFVAVRGPYRAARELLAFAAFSRPQPRLAAVNLVHRIGSAAHMAWREALRRPELRGYARIALAARLTESATPDLDPDPDDLTAVATDLLALACGDEDPDSQEMAVQFSQAVPEGQESWLFALMSQSSHPDVAKALSALGWYHPDRRIAKEARRAARGARRKQREA
jgi:hypothetical protein